MSKVLIDLYERALKASWPEGAKGEAFDLWNEARILQQEPAADCGLEVFTVPGRYLAVNKKNPGAQDVVLKSDADARIAELERLKRARIDALETEIAAFRAERDQLRAELAALKAQEQIGEIYDVDGVYMAIWANGTPDVGTKLYAAPVKQEAVSDAARDVMAERQRQISAEGWTPEHDNEHSDGSMALAASCYACASTGRDDSMRDWPWSQEWFKPSTPRRSLVKAAALILAEIDRLDRAAQGEKP